MLACVSTYMQTRDYLGSDIPVIVGGGVVGVPGVPVVDGVSVGVTGVTVGVLGVGVGVPGVPVVVGGVSVGVPGVGVGVPGVPVVVLVFSFFFPSASFF